MHICRARTGFGFFGHRYLMLAPRWSSYNSSHRILQQVF